MADRLVLVNGLPGSGKSTLAAGLAERLGAQLVAKDAIKEALVGAVAGAPSAVLGAAAMEAAWVLVAGSPGTVVLDAWLYRPRDLHFVEGGLITCGKPPVVEVWCDVAPQLAIDRYAGRERHPVHEDAERLASYSSWTAGAEPLGLAPTLRVRTEGPVDIERVAREVRRALAS
jgi:predicted kinase